MLGRALRQSGAALTGTPACCTVKVCPATISVPARGSAVVLPATPERLWQALTDPECTRQEHGASRRGARTLNEENAHHLRASNDEVEHVIDRKAVVTRG